MTTETRMTNWTPRERAAYDAGLRAALEMARVVALTMETALDASDVRKRAAAGAFHAFVDAAGALALTSSQVPDVMATIASMPGDAGEIICPECSGRFRWIKCRTNGHIHGQCEAGCLTVMQ